MLSASLSGQSPAICVDVGCHAAENSSIDHSLDSRDRGSSNSRDACLMDYKPDRRLTQMVIVGEEDETNIQSVELVRREAKHCGTWERCVACLLVFLLVCCGGLIAIWCCANSRSAAAAAAAPDQKLLKPKQELTVPNMHVGENCTNSTPAQVRAWSPKKKQWCCKHQHQGCPNSTIEMSTSTLTISGCEAQCTLKGTSASCRSRVLFAARFLFATRDNPCHSAYDWVISKCPQCSDCQNSSSSCHMQPATTSAAGPTEKHGPTTASAAVANANHACDAQCMGNGGAISCRGRVAAIANSTFAGDPDACVLAFASMLKSCQVCASCPLADVGCSATTRAEKPSDR